MDLFIGCFKKSSKYKIKNACWIKKIILVKKKLNFFKQSIDGHFNGLPRIYNNIIVYI